MRYRSAKCEMIRQHSMRRDLKRQEVEYLDQGRN